jgi:NAD(P)H-flavin reductase
MPIAKYTSKLSEKVTLNPKFRFLQLELQEPHRIEFNAGQYILLEIPTSARKRQYSITSAPRLDHAIQLLVEIVENGQASEYLEQIPIGEQVSFWAPAGEFVIKEEVQNSQDPLVFVGTGSGLAPLRSLILDQLRTKEAKRPIKLHWGMRQASDLFWLDYFEELRKNYSNFSYDITLSQPPEGWTLCKGRVTNCLSVHELLPNAHYYICGNPGMIEDSMKVLKERGITDDHMHHEKFS